MNKQQIHIREATSGDSESLSRFAAQAFLEAYEGTMNASDIEDYISNAFNINTILEQIQSPEMIFHIGIQQEEILGYTKLRWDRQRPELKNLRSIEMERIYVDKGHYRFGLGSVLLQHAIDYSRNRKLETLWLAVWQKNERALSFYKKSGLEIFGVQEFTVGSLVNKDYVLKTYL